MSYTERRNKELKKVYLIGSILFFIILIAVMGILYLTLDLLLI